MTRLAISGDYTADWPAISRATKDGAGWRCVRCSHPFNAETGRPLGCDEACDPNRGRRCRCDACKNGRITDSGFERHHTGPGMNYGVHHLDGDKSNNAWWNCLALCNSCHLSVQSTVIPERLWAFHHSEWFRIYAAGYYADQDGVPLTREQVAADIDHWLGVGQPWLAPPESATVCTSYP